jgi:WD40 repeat protein
VLIVEAAAHIGCLFWKSIHSEQRQQNAERFTMADPADAATGDKPRLKLAWGLGLRPDVVNCVVSLDDATVLYPQGRALAVHNLETNEMSFVSGGADAGIPIAVALAPSRKYVAVCEEEIGDEPPGIGYYDLQTSRRLRTLTCAAAGSSRFVCAAFSADGKHLAAASAAPGFLLVLWSLDKGRVVASVKQPGLHTRVSFMPGENKHTTLCASGPRSLRLWSLVSETQLKETVVTVGKRGGDQPDYNDHCWIRAATRAGGVRGGAGAGGVACAAAVGSGSTVTAMATALGLGQGLNVQMEAVSSDAAGGSSGDASPPTLCVVTQSGAVHFLSGGSELQQSVTLSRAEGDGNHSSYLPSDEKSRQPPSALRVSVCTRGVLVSGAGGLFALLELRADGAYAQTRAFTCSPPRAVGGGGEAASDINAEDGVKRTRRAETADIVSMCMGRAQESVVVATTCGKLGSFPLSSIDLLSNESSPFSFSGGGLIAAHRGPIHGLQSCAAKSVLATCGADFTVRLWDYSSRACLLVKQMADEPLCLSLHPSGDLIVIGFADRLALYHVLIDDLRQVALFPAKNAREVCFSHGGGAIAAVTNAHIHLYDAYSHATLGLLRGHIGAVRRVAWSSDDACIVSCGQDGAVYLWDVSTRQRLIKCDHVCKAEQYEAVAVAPTTREGGIPLVAAAHTGVLRGLLVGGVVPAGVDGGPRAHDKADVGSRPRALCLSASDRTLFVGTQEGGLRGYAWPLGLDGRAGVDAVIPPEWMSVHGGAVNRLALSHDETMLFSVSEDGQLFMWELVGGEAVAAVLAVPAWRREARLRDSLDTVLVSRSWMRDKATAFADLREKMDRMSAQAEYQAHVREQVLTEERRQMRERAEAEVREAEKQMKELREQLAEHQSVTALSVAATEEEHMKTAEELELLYERKLAAEAGRFEALRRQAEDASAAFEREIHAVHLIARAREERLGAELSAARADGESRLQEARREAEVMRVRYEETLLQEEEYGEAATAHAVKDKAAIVAAEREVVREVRGEAAVLRRKLESATAEAERARQQVSSLDEQLAAAQRERAESDRTVHLLRREVAERTAKNSDLERRSSELKSSNKELEKFKYVLDFKLREMRKDAEPKEEALGAMRDTIRELDAEMQKEYASTLEREAGLAERGAQVEALQAEVRGARAEVAQRDQLLASVNRQLHMIVSSDAALWRESTIELQRDLCNRLRGEGVAASSLQNDDAVAAEQARQRMYMERALDTVKTRVGRTESQARVDLQKKLAENQVLLAEVNSLRYEAKVLRRKNDQLQTQLLTANALAEAASPVSPAAAPRIGVGTAAASRSLPSRSSSVLMLVPPSTPPSSAGLRHSASAGALRRPASAAPSPGVLLGGSGRPLTPSHTRGQLVRGRLSAPPERQRGHAPPPPPPPGTGHRRLGSDVARLREEVCTLLGSERH